ncbi:MAG: hypothetical protein DRQ40_04685 [Gammaproteobacteria bacterium]|nr:MAG: hypothetical protein DRQ40_04685 [Gammaproteobacteria bacterium]
MKDEDALKTENITKDTEPTNNPDPVSEDVAEGSDKRVWKDEDILEHALDTVKTHMDRARASNFKVEISYSDLRLFSESVSIAINRTREGNRIAKIMEERFEAIKGQLVHINNLATLRVTSETD